MAFVTDNQAPELVDPSKGALDDPSVLAQMLAAFDAAAGNARRDVSSLQVTPAAIEVVSLVGVELGRSVPGPSSSLTNRVDGVNNAGQGLAVVAVGSGQGDGERQATPIHDDVALGAWLAPVGWVGTDRVPPFLAGTDEASTQARDQSIWPARLSRSSMCRWRRSHRPVSCQARRRRQHVMPEHPATSKGKRSQGIAVYRTNKMPISASREPTGGRPPFGRGKSGGNNGAISVHNASGRSFLAMPPGSAQHS